MDCVCDDSVSRVGDDRRYCAGRDYGEELGRRFFIPTRCFRCASGMTMQKVALRATNMRGEYIVPTSFSILFLRPDHVVVDSFAFSLCRYIRR